MAAENGSGERDEERSEVARLLESFYTRQESFLRDLEQRFDRRLRALQEEIERLRAELEYESGDLRRRLERLDLSVDEVRRRRRVDERFLDHVQTRGVPPIWERQQVPDLAGMVGSFTDDEVDAPRFDD